MRKKFIEFRYINIIAYADSQIGKGGAYPRETVKYDIRIQICAQKFLGRLTSI